MPFRLPSESMSAPQRTSGTLQEYGSYILQPVPRNPRPRCRLPPIFAPSPFPPPSLKVQVALGAALQGLLDELTMEYDRESLGHKGLE